MAQNAIVIGGGPHVAHNIGRVVVAEFDHMMSNEPLPDIHMYTTSPPLFTVDGRGPVFYEHTHLAILPPEVEVVIEEEIEA